MKVVSFSRLGIAGSCLMLMFLYVATAGQGLADTDVPQSFVIMDFEDGVLRDREWLRKQPAGAYTHIGPYGSRGARDSYRFSIDKGAGRNGGNALLIESDSPEEWMPGFWIYRMTNRGGRVRGPEKYLLPDGQRANRLSFWLRFEPGYRAVSSAAQPPRYPNHRNMDVGTYHTRNFADNSVESDNWHFYHQIWLRHDLADGDWMYLELNEAPTHQRNWGDMTPPVNPTLPFGNYWEIATRFYFGGGSRDPEIGPPFRVWIDDIRLSYVPPATAVTVRFNEHESGDVVAAPLPVQLPFTVTNNGNDRVCGAVWAHSYYNNRPDYGRLKKMANWSGQGEEVCLAAGESRSYPFSLHGAYGRYAVVGFTEERFRNRSESAVNQSLSDPRVERRWIAELGTNDAEVSSAFVRYQPR